MKIVLQDRVDKLLFIRLIKGVKHTEANYLIDLKSNEIVI
jgi:hypothetical protein